MSTEPAHIVDVLVPKGTWNIDPASSQDGFTVRTLWGLSKVRGTFALFHGKLISQPDGLDGELVIDAASLSTKNKQRDTHLRSADFFDVERHPEITFAMRSIQTHRHGVAIGGDLHVGDATVPLELIVTAEQRDGRMHLSTEASVTRESVGMTWNKLGMVRGDAHLSLQLELTRAG
jgi:polyisoprenoid-binding protein YceI